MLPGACADGGRQHNDKVKTHDDIACLLMWSLIVLFIANDQTGSFSLFLQGIFTSWGITEQHAWRQAITHLTSIIIKITIYFTIASKNIFWNFLLITNKNWRKKNWCLGTSWRRWTRRFLTWSRSYTWLTITKVIRFMRSTIEEQQYVPMHAA